MTWKEIDNKAVEIASQFLRSEADLLEIVTVVHAQKVFRELGLSSTYDYCVKRLNLSTDHSLNLIRIVRKSETVPELGQAVVDGTLSVSRAKKISSVVTPENHEVWIQKAVELPTAVLERAVATENPREKVPDRLRPISESLTGFQCAVDRETEALLREAQDLVSRSERTSVDMNTTLKAVLTRFIRQHHPAPRAVAKQIGPAEVPAMRNGKRVALPAAIKRSVQERDQGACTFVHPIYGRCENRRWTELHHTVEVSRGGVHAVDKLTTLCSEHHRMQHDHEKWSRTSFSKTPLAARMGDRRG